MTTSALINASRVRMGLCSLALLTAFATLVGCSGSSPALSAPAAREGGRALQHPGIPPTCAGLATLAPEAPSGGVSSTPILKRLIRDGWRPGADLEASVRPIGARARSVRCYEVRFTSHQWRGKPVRIFGYLACPATAGRLPAVLFVHGGGGFADLPRAAEAARKGYVALCIDLPGKGPHRSLSSRSTGPDMTVEQLFTVHPSLSDNYIYHAVLAQMRAVTFLRTRPEVDPARIGLLGISWGGATGLITAALDKRLRCFVDLYGAGYLSGGSAWHGHLAKLPPADADAWAAHFDPARYVADIGIPVLGVTGTNDNCYYLPRFLHTLAAIHPTPELILLPNLQHRIDPAAHQGIYRWLERHLKREPTPGSPGIAQVRFQTGGSAIVMQVRPAGRLGVRRAQVCFSPAGSGGWTNRAWTTVPCAPDRQGLWWSAPIQSSAQLTYAFATVQFDDGSLVSAPVHSLSRVWLQGKAIALGFPRIYQGPLLAEAGLLAAVLGARQQACADPARIAVIRGSHQVEVVAQRIGDLRFIPVRETCARLGFGVTFRSGRVELSFPRSAGPTRDRRGSP